MNGTLSLDIITTGHGKVPVKVDVIVSAVILDYGDKPEKVDSHRWNLFDQVIEPGEQKHSFEIWHKIDGLDLVKHAHGSSGKRKRVDVQSVDVAVIVALDDVQDRATCRISRHEPSAKVAKMPIEKPEEKHADNHEEKHAEKHVEKHEEKHVEKHTEPAVEKPAEKKPVEKPPAEKKVEKKEPAEAKPDVEMRDADSPSEQVSDASGPKHKTPVKRASAGGLTRMPTNIDFNTDSLPPLPDSFPFNLTFKQFVEVRGRDDVDGLMKWCRARALYYRRARVTYMDGRQEEGWVIFVNYYGHPSKMDDGIFLDEEGLKLFRPPTIPANQWPTRKSSTHSELFAIGNVDSDKFFSEPIAAYDLGKKSALDAVLMYPNAWVRTFGPKIYKDDRLRGLQEDDEDDPQRFTNIEFWYQEGGKEGKWK